MRAIQGSLREHGQVLPLVLRRSDRMVIGGNGTVEAMRREGWTHANAVFRDYDAHRARRLSIVLNRSGELAGWDQVRLAGQLQELMALAESDVELGLGFNEQEMVALQASLNDPALLALASTPPPAPAPGANPNAPGAPGTAGGGGGMPSSHVRMVQLFFNEETEPQFRELCRKAADQLMTKNITDTVFEVMKRGFGT